MLINQDLDLVILVGGKGSRIRKFTKKTPKPLIKINGIQFVQYLINFYSKYNFRKIFLLTGYKSIQFNKFHNKIINSIPIECIVEKEKLDTGGSLAQIRNRVSNNFILINGDSFVDYDFNNFFKKKISKKKIAKMLVVKNSNYKSNNKLSNLKIEKNFTLNFEGNLMNAGVYHLNKKIFRYLKEKRISLEKQVLQILIKKKLVCGVYSKETLIDIGTYSNFKKSKKYFENYSNKLSFFFDRDGVINLDNNYVYKIKDFIFRKNVIKAIKYLNQKKINVFVVTNQAGIARGIYKEEDFFLLSKFIKKKLSKNNAFIDQVEFCPFHPKSKIKKYKKKSNYRKPGNLMIEKIKKNWGSKSLKSFMIGDKKSDKDAAIKSGLYFEYVEKDIFLQIKKILSKYKI